MAHVLTLVLALLVAAPAPASAASATASRTTRAAKHRPVAAHDRDPVAAAAAIAKRYWHAVPCGGHIRIVADQPLAAGLDPSTDAWVTFGSSLGANDLDAPAATYTACTISLAHWQWASRNAMEGDWGMFCLTVVHEMGHLLGHKHSLKPRSVMAPVFTSEANVPAACAAAWLPGR